MKQLFLTLVFLFAFLGRVSAQELTVKSFAAAPMDLTASTHPRLDLNKQPCALVKVQLAAADAQFDGNVLGDCEYKAGEYWVYMSQGSYQLKIRHPNFVPLTVNFRDYGIRGVESKATYVLTLLKPQAPQAPEEKKQMLIINYTPKDATVVIDSKLQKGNGRVEVELSLGEHSYMIVADGYITAEGTVKLNGGNQRVLNETLEREAVATTTPVATSTVPTTTAMPTQVTQMQESIPTMGVTSGSGAVETFTVGGVQFRMVRVAGGTFQMGSNDRDADNDEEPVHQVTLSDYYIGETEVTQALWEVVMGNNPSRFKGENLPVENVSWDDCQEFIEKLNILIAHTGYQFRLPTEAEWEYAARGGSQGKGFKYSGSDDIGSVAWYDGNSGDKTHPVGTKQANELGLYDMSGNVWEWCQDWYGSYGSSAQTDPKGPSNGSFRVDRGGSWGNGARGCRSSFRSGYTPSGRVGGLGLRLAL